MKNEKKYKCAQPPNCVHIYNMFFLVDLVHLR
jgi:hypothetical protein